MKPIKCPIDRFKVRVFHWFILLVFIFSFCSGEAKLLQHPLKIDVEVSTGDLVKNSSSIPLTIDISNGGEAFQGQLAVEYQKNYKGEPDIYYQDIDVPKYGKKRFFIYIPEVSYAHQLTVRVSKGNDSITQDIQLNRRINETDVLLMALNRSQTAPAYISGFKTVVPQNTTLNVVAPNPQKLPIHWKAYSSVNIILINDLPSLHLDRPREEAILNFVKSGGILVFSSNLDPNEFNASLFKEYLPLKLRETQMEKHEGFIRGEETLITGEIEGESLSKVELNAGNIPLLISKPLGRGKVFFLTADLSKKPFHETYEEEKIWKPIIDFAGTLYGQKTGLDLATVMEQLPEMEPPPVGVICYALLAYIIIIGPINYFYLKKKDKLIYMYITVPCIALIFSLGIFFIGFSFKGSQIILRNISVVPIREGEKSCFVNSTFSLFSPQKIDYQITLPYENQTGWEMGYYGNLPALKVEQDEKMTFRNVEIKMWAMKQFQTQRIMDLEGSIDLNITQAEQNFSGTISNNSGKSLKDCFIFYNGTVSKKFNLSAGENTVNITFQQNNMKSAREIKDTLEKMYDLKNPSREQVMSQPRKKILQALSNEIVKEKDRFYLIGWNSQDINPIKIDRQGARYYTEAIYIIQGLQE